MSCSICLESLQNGIINTECNHTFHKICLEKWLNLNNTCPYCRNVITRSVISRKENNRYRVRELYSGNYFEGELIEKIYTYSNSLCYKFTNITNNKYPMGDICYVYDNLIKITNI
jgi:hypothetical protein